MATTATALPIIDLDVFLAQGETSDKALAECKKASEALWTYGALLVKDSRVSDEDNQRFLDLFEDYFAQPDSVLKEDERPELSYQVGVTLENTEKPKCAADVECLTVIAKLNEAERPLDISGHHPDPKCRFFYRPAQDAPPYETSFPALNAANVVPRDPRFAAVWHEVLGKWANSMKNAVEGVAQMSAVGFGLPRTTFTDAGRYGPHLLAPTASNLNKYNQPDTILAGFHTDLNFLTIHAASRYPGLHIWARNTGKRIPVAVPRGMLLVQAGKQLEHLTGGYVRAGFHEVVVNDKTIETINRRTAEFPDRPLIRISSTFFWHLSSDFDLQPIQSLQEEDTLQRYPLMKVGEQVQQELRHIALMA
ncbi:Clavaminate synthase-like protein [Auriculariales sp. MPI-PUGE-AT-0066]|nr:Clavaminate synthase-like protein [Auriculariales sp. MPI-PUGE-AT-0066]